MSELPFEIPKAQVETISHKAELEEIAISFAFMRETFEIDDNFGVDFLHDQLRAKMRGFVLAGMPKEVTVSLLYPSNWWQYTKGKILEKPLTPLGKWLRTKFSLRVEEVTNTETVHRRICPHGLIEVPNRHLQWLAGPETYTNRIEELEKSVDHWRLRAQAFERRSEWDRATITKQAQIIRKGFGQ